MRPRKWPILDNTRSYMEGAALRVHSTTASEQTSMPYLQLDTTFKHSDEHKRALAKRLGEIYSVHMSANVNRLTVAIRELGAGSIWRCAENAPYPAGTLMLDIRESRSAATREALPGSCSELARRSSASPTRISTSNSRSIATRCFTPVSAAYATTGDRVKRTSSTR